MSTSNVAIKPTFGSAIEALYLMFIHACLALRKTAQAAEEVVDLARNEIGNIDEMQQIRLDLTKAERVVQRKAFAEAAKASK